MGWIQALTPNIFPNQHFALSHIREGNSLFRYSICFKMWLCFEINRSDCPYHIRRKTFMIRYEMTLLPSPLVILKYCQLVFKMQQLKNMDINFFCLLLCCDSFLCCYKYEYQVTGTIHFCAQWFSWGASDKKNVCIKTSVIKSSSLYNFNPAAVLMDTISSTCSRWLLMA